MEEEEPATGDVCVCTSRIMPWRAKDPFASTAKKWGNGHGHGCRVMVAWVEALAAQDDVSYSIVRPTAFFKSVSGQLEVGQGDALSVA